MKLAALFLCALAVACNDNGDTCSDVRADFGDLCLPDTIAPGLVTNIQLAELCGNSCSDLPSCTAVLRAGAVTIDGTENACLSAQSQTCLQAGCLQRIVPCSLPALNEGEYTLVIPGGPSRLLKVASGGLSACRLPQPDAGL